MGSGMANGYQSAVIIALSAFELEKAAQMANHASTRTTQLNDRRADEVTLDEVERIII